MHTYIHTYIHIYIQLTITRSMKTGTKPWVSGYRMVLHAHTGVCPTTMDRATGCSGLSCDFTYALRYSELSVCFH